MKLEFFLKEKIKAGVALLELELPRLDAEDFEFVRGQIEKVSRLLTAEMQVREAGMSPGGAELKKRKEENAADGG